MFIIMSFKIMLSNVTTFYSARTHIRSVLSCYSSNNRRTHSCGTLAYCILTGQHPQASRRNVVGRL